MPTMYWENGALHLLDQTVLPGRSEYAVCRSYRDVIHAIRTMKVRGAPAIGVAAAYGLALAAREAAGAPDPRERLRAAAEELKGTRPTAVNLAWAVDRLLAKTVATPGADPAALLLEEAERLAAEDEAANRRLGEYGRALLPHGARVITHCNAGALATAGYGTALGVIRAAREAGNHLRVYATETRPLLQGARLTCWELMQEGIPVTLITDSMAGFLMARGMADLVLVGADRIAANGDVANKIGTYTLAVLAREHGLPFYVAAPFSTVDLATPSGAEIPIEERAPEEVTHVAGTRTAPEGVGVWNPAFDVTPARLVTAIITDLGVVRPPYGETLPRVAGPREAPP
ncbi:MAG: S-methyl-5-thioribose-1-phosphate isomerase [Desulfotomaculales bacterium]